ncbi:hypothetical protein [Streptomyces sp. NPDC017435]|uniref:hypothetical protein n=1 Tax=Streptomyces sp. NPDC017435 TaxID=3364995 RepID=UPI0037A9C7E0
MFFTGDRARASPRPGRAGSEPSGRTGRRAAPSPKRIIYIAAGGCPAAGPVVCANSLGVASPSQISGVQHPALMIFMVVIGGTGTVEGPVIGALAYLAAAEKAQMAMRRDLGTSWPDRADGFTPLSG